MFGAAADRSSSVSVACFRRQGKTHPQLPTAAVAANSDTSMSETGHRALLCHHTGHRALLYQKQATEHFYIRSRSNSTSVSEAGHRALLHQKPVTEHFYVRNRPQGTSVSETDHIALLSQKRVTGRALLYQKQVTGASVTVTSVAGSLPFGCSKVTSSTVMFLLRKYCHEHIYIH